MAGFTTPDLQTDRDSFVAHQARKHGAGVFVLVLVLVWMVVLMTVVIVRAVAHGSPPGGW